MKKSILIITAIATCLIYSCKKDANNRIANTNSTYELDSVVETQLDTLNNFISSRTIPITANYVRNLLAPASHLTANGVEGITYEERTDSLILKQLLVNLPFTNIVLLDDAYIINGKFNYIYHDALRYNGRDGHTEYIQSLIYDSNQHLYTIKDKVESSTDEHKKVTYNKIFNYANGNINTINESNVYFLNYPDSTIVNNSYDFSYPNHYPNQKNLIGIDVNDLWLAAFLNLSSSSTTQKRSDFFGESNAYALSAPEIYLYDLPVPLIVNQQATFNTSCENLLEKINYNFTISNINITLNTSIAYEFDAKHNNRITSMIINYPINPPVIFEGKKYKYTFYYKN